MAKKFKLTEQQLSTLVAEASYRATLAAKGTRHNNVANENESLAQREAEGRLLEMNRTNLEQAEMQKVLNCLKGLNDEVKKLKKDNQKLVKTVETLEKFNKKQVRDFEYAEGHLADIKQDVRELNSEVKKIKKQAKESKKILQIFGAIMQISKPSDELKVIRKKFTDALLIYNTKRKSDKSFPYEGRALDVF